MARTSSRVVRLPPSLLILTDLTNTIRSEAYRASKTLAEKAAWSWLAENTKNGIAPFDLATINPPYAPSLPPTNPS